MAGEKQITVTRADEVAMAAIRADPQILEEHLAVEATIDVSRADAVMRLAALNDCRISGSSKTLEVRTLGCA